jgi:nitroreductase
MEFDQVVRTRRSIRRYSVQPPAESVIAELLELVRWAPSSMNGQPWHFVLVREPATKHKLAALKNRFVPADKRAFPADFLVAAPWIIVICVDRELAHDRELENGLLAAGWLLLAATSRGLGSVYLSAYQPRDPGLERELAALLSLPPQIRPISIVPLGYPAETPAAKTVRPLASILHHERY